MYDRRSRNRGGVSPIVIMLLAQIYNQLNQLPVKPPVTVALLAANIGPHIIPHLNIWGYYLSDINGNCLQPSKIITAYLNRGDFLWNRLVLSGFIHADDHHLYYNMLSLLWKGIHLETVLGSETFLVLVVYSLLMSHLIAVLLTYIMFVCLNFSEYDAGYNTCAVGFSAVLFSLKYVHNSMSTDAFSSLMGMSVATKYICWLELVVIHFMVPRSSFVGHLSGILAGVIYVHGLSAVLRKVSGRGARNHNNSSNGNNNHNAGYARTGTASSGFNNGNTSRYTYASGRVG